MNSFEVIKNAVAAHLGITIISPALCRLEFAAKTLVPIRVRGLRVERNFNLIYRKDRLLSHAARALVSLVRKKLRPAPLSRDGTVPAQNIIKEDSHARENLSFPSSSSINLLAQLFPDAKAAEDQAQDVFNRGLAGNAVQGVQGIVEINEDHLVGNLAAGSGAGLAESVERIADELLVAKVGNELICAFKLKQGNGGGKDLFLQILEFLFPSKRRFEQRRGPCGIRDRRRSHSKALSLRLRRTSRASRPC